MPAGSAGPSERTPFAPDDPAAAARRVTEKLPQQRSFANRLCLVPTLAVRRHGTNLLLTFLSTVVCFCSGYGAENIIDPMIFKAIFLVFGFSLGFRNVRANARRGDALEAMSKLFRSSWGILAVFPPASLPKVREPLVLVLRALARHVRLISSETNWWYGISGLEPAPSRAPEEAQEVGVFGFRWWWRRPQAHEVLRPELGPEAMARAFLVTAEAELERLEAGLSQQRRRRTFWADKVAFLTAVDRVEAFSIPSVSARYKVLVDTCLLLLSISLPWGISVDRRLVGLSRYIDYYDYLGRLRPGVGLLLGINTMLVAIMLLGMNALAEETEDPFGEHEEDVDLDGETAAFEVATLAYERDCAAAKPSGGAAAEEAADKLDPDLFARACSVSGYGVALEQREPVAVV